MTDDKRKAFDALDVAMAKIERDFDAMCKAKGFDSSPIKLRSANYILTEDREPLEVDAATWAVWFETANRRVARTELPGGGFISTVFLGLDHGYFKDEPPILFETMSKIGDEWEDYFERYATWAEAEAGHARIVAEALAAIEKANAGLDAALKPKPPRR